MYTSNDCSSAIAIHELCDTHPAHKNCITTQRQRRHHRSERRKHHAAHPNPRAERGPKQLSARQLATLRALRLATVEPNPGPEDQQTLYRRVVPRAYRVRNAAVFHDCLVRAIRTNLLALPFTTVAMAHPPDYLIVLITSVHGELVYRIPEHEYWIYRTHRDAWLRDLLREGVEPNPGPPPPPCSRPTCRFAGTLHFHRRPPQRPAPRQQPANQNAANAARRINLARAFYPCVRPDGSPKPLDECQIREHYHITAAEYNESARSSPETAASVLADALAIHADQLAAAQDVADGIHDQIGFRRDNIVEEWHADDDEAAPVAPPPFPVDPRLHHTCTVVVLTCAICHEEFTRDDLVIQPRCNHIVHQTCAHGWWGSGEQNHALCSVCRDPLRARPCGSCHTTRTDLAGSCENCRLNADLAAAGPRPALYTGPEFDEAAFPSVPHTPTQLDSPRAAPPPLAPPRNRTPSPPPRLAQLPPPAHMTEAEAFAAAPPPTHAALRRLLLAAAHDKRARLAAQRGAASSATSSTSTGSSATTTNPTAPAHAESATSATSPPPSPRPHRLPLVNAPWVDPATAAANIANIPPIGAPPHPRLPADLAAAIIARHLAHAAALHARRLPPRAAPPLAPIRAVAPLAPINPAILAAARRGLRHNAAVPDAAEYRGIRLNPYRPLPGIAPCHECLTRTVVACVACHRAVCAPCCVDHGTHEPVCKCCDQAVDTYGGPDRPASWDDHTIIPYARVIPPLSASLVVPVFFHDKPMRDPARWRSVGQLLFDVGSSILGHQAEWLRTGPAPPGANTRTTSTFSNALYMLGWRVERPPEDLDMIRFYALGMVRYEMRTVSPHAVASFFCAKTSHVSTGSAAGVNTSSATTIAYYLSENRAYDNMPQDIMENTVLFISNLLAIRSNDRKNSLPIFQSEPTTSPVVSGSASRKSVQPTV